MAFNGGDNNDGITVIDITNLTHVRYCFVFFLDDLWIEEEEDEKGDTAWGSSPRMTPLSGPMYLSDYFNAEERSNDPKLQTQLQALEQQFDKWDLIDTASLANIWPRGEWRIAETEPMAGAGM